MNFEEALEMIKGGMREWMSEWGLVVCVPILMIVLGCTRVECDRLRLENQQLRDTIRFVDHGKDAEGCKLIRMCKDWSK